MAANFDNDLLQEFGLNDTADAERRDEGLGAFVTVDVEKLADTWRTEANAPDILPYQQDLVDKIQEVLDKQTATVEELLEETEEDGKQDLYFSITLYQMDIERVRYSLARYLRTRLLKIERSLDSILSDTTFVLRDRLSSKEKKFAETLSSMNKAYFDDQLKNRLIDDAQKFYTTDAQVLHSTPNLDKYVYFRATSLVQLTDGDGRIREIRAGEVACAAYGGSVKDFVLQGKVVLL